MRYIGEIDGGIGVELDMTIKEQIEQLPHGTVHFEQALLDRGLSVSALKALAASHTGFASQLFKH